MLCQHIEKLQPLPLAATYWNIRLPVDEGVLRVLIRSVIRDELYRDTSPSSLLARYNGLASTLREIVREKLARLHALRYINQTFGRNGVTPKFPRYHTSLIFRINIRSQAAHPQLSPV